MSYIQTPVHHHCPSRKLTVRWQETGLPRPLSPWAKLDPTCMVGSCPFKTIIRDRTRHWVKIKSIYWKIVSTRQEAPTLLTLQPWQRRRETYRTSYLSMQISKLNSRRWPRQTTVLWSRSSRKVITDRRPDHLLAWNGTSALKRSADTSEMTTCHRKMNGYNKTKVPHLRNCKVGDPRLWHKNAW